jgi:hypothetical protein
VLVTRTVLEGALKRVESLLLEANVVEAVLARREAGVATVDDDENVSALAEELLTHQQSDGSWNGDTGRTAEALLLLGELLVDSPSHEQALHAVEWLRLRQDQPGSFESGCDVQRHALDICAHALPGGFFSAGSPQLDLSGRTLANGLRFPDDADARLGLSALALRASMRWTPPTENDVRQISGLTRLAEHAYRSGKPAPAGAAALTQVMAALAAAPRGPEIAASLHGALSRLASMQRADGSWSDLEAFHVLDLFLGAMRRGYGSSLFDSAVQRAAEMLTFTQKSNGSWGGGADPYQLLTSWRALRHTVLLSSMS